MARLLMVVAVAIVAALLHGQTFAQSDPIQSRFAKSKDPVAAACNARCVSRIVGSTSCFDTQYVKCLNDVAKGNIVDGIGMLRQTPDPRSYCHTDGEAGLQYKFSEIREYFPLEVCMAAVQGKLDEIAQLEKDRKDAALQREDEERAQAAERLAQRDRLRAELKSGARQPATFAEQMMRDDVNDVLAIVILPKLSPDRAAYGLIGVISNATNASEFEAVIDIPGQVELMFRAAGTNVVSRRVYLKSTKATADAVKKHGRIGAVFSAYGRYVANKSTVLRDGRRVLVPVLELTAYEGL